MEPFTYIDYGKHEALKRFKNRNMKTSVCPVCFTCVGHNASHLNN